ncbi:proton-translocating NADH-quinone oxidoreductase subunit L [Marinobacter santoriniensis NKSG1]|uniref:Proton-translocating NADH-quinone oxidoreductase subunit L n=1 Tax=Marinobacter santoriniensis NKSG1 TaxID=1288826 RepID=M7DAL5_9GAMM|nr:NADH-quinone oxidoreductase subunit L [Marinobacter santoriniensis]EMP54707.1 proton-translocating NADH-quinone oxidoreductase subunit L [Marinobacter santoriniensis NKSG1]
MMDLPVTLSFICPLIGTLVLALSSGRLGPRVSSLIGVVSIGLAALATAWTISLYVAGDGAVRFTLWTWIQAGAFKPTIGLSVDGLALVMMAVITGVGFFIHLFAAWYMAGDDGVTRFYAWMNLFVFSMLILVLADNLMLLFLGWEGVGLCSYLLIGYYYQDSANGRAAFKAFLVTRVGDLLLALGLFLLFNELGTLDIQQVMARAAEAWSVGDPTATVAALLILGGALGKSAQVPLHTWLPDAMAGPTPVSALIHAATMVTAGVYLIARLNGLFLLAPQVLWLVGVIGAVSLLLAAFAALAQTDIKRVLAFSTMSQIGYMFLALGAGAFDAAIFHLVTHAFFKALLFLSAGAVITSCHHEQDMARLGGLRKRLPLAYAGFLVGGSALVALPLVTAGFYSKDEILWQAMASGHQGFLLAGLLGAFLTCLYTVRLIVGTFHGDYGSDNARHAEQGSNPLTHHLPLVVLAGLSTALGAWLYPHLDDLFPAPPGASAETGHTLLQTLATGTVIAGLAVAAWLFLARRRWLQQQASRGVGALLWRIWHQAWGVDVFYDRLLVKPWLFLVRVLRHDVVNMAMNLPALLSRILNGGLVRAQNGRIRSYATVMVLGATIILLALVLFPGGAA